ncbi:MAG: acyl-CoA dehydrogenase family protein [Steroidobacteraceae bacterium]
MNLDFSEEQKSLQEELRRFLQRRGGIASARDALEGRAPCAAALWRELGEAGWLAVALPERHGGQDLGHEMLCLVAEELGRSMSAVPFASSICLVAEALLQSGSDAQRERWLPELGAGRAVGAFAIAERAGPLHAASLGTRLVDGRLHGSKTGVSDGLLADVLLVVALEGGEPRLCLVAATAAGVTRSAQVGVDPSHAPALVRFDGAVAEPLPARGWSAVQSLLDRAAVLLAFEQIGVADAALALSLDYARQRVAFGRVIGGYQAIKHKLADVWTANQLARANAYYAAYALQSQPQALPLAAATARVAAGEALERAARELIQVHGGIGVAWEHDAHLYYRRSQQLALQLGGLREWQDRLATQLALTA